MAVYGENQMMFTTGKNASAERNGLHRVMWDYCMELMCGPSLVCSFIADGFELNYGTYVMVIYVTYFMI